MVAGSRITTSAATEASIPTPASGQASLFFDSDAGNAFAYKDSAGVVHPLAGGVSGWFNVRNYGALGDGATDDRAAINLAIAALNTAGAGVLYFPASALAYLVSASLTTITARCLILGDGWYTAGSGTISRISFSSTSTSLFTVSANGCLFRDLAMVQTGGTASAGAAITTTGGILAGFEGLLLSAFYQGIDIENSNLWTLRRSYIENSVHYGIRIRNTAAPDSGDWVIDSCVFSNTVAGDAAIRMESSGGGKIIASKINGNASGANRYTYGIDVAIGTGGSTSVLLIEANSLENVTTDAIRIVTSGSGTFGLVNIVGNESGLYGNNSGRTVNLSNTGLVDVLVAHNNWKTNGTARAAVSVTNSTNVRIGPNVLDTFNAEYTNSGGTIIDDTGATGATISAFATPAIVLGTAAAAGAATTVIRSDATIVAFDATVPAAIGTAAAGSQAVAARRDHVHPNISAHGARANRASTNQSVGNNTYTAIAFDGADSYDTDAIHDTSTNNSRMIIPTIAGVTTGLWSIKASGYTDAALGRTDVAFRVNAAGNPASGTIIGFATELNAAGTTGYMLTTDYVFTAADYVECFVRTSGGSYNAIYDAGVSPIFEIAFLGKVT